MWKIFLSGLPVARTGKMALSATVYGALMTNIWESFEQQGIREDLQSVVLQNTEGTVMVIKIHQMLLAVVADNSVTQGILRAKVMALTTHLMDPLGML